MDIIRLNDQQLEQLHSILYDMMCEVDRICRKHKIRYIICGGTLLGAVRHKGFIPWDDDVDIRMERKEYDKFCRVCQQELDPDKYFFQTYKTDPDYPWFYGKLRYNYSRYVRNGQEHLKMNDGIFVDIFVSDGLPNERSKQRLVLKCCYVLKKILYSEVGCVREKNPVKRFGYVLLNKIPRSLVYSAFEAIARKYSDRKKYRYTADYSFSTTSFNDVAPRKCLLQLKQVTFNDRKFLTTYDIDRWLTKNYGDYMQLPPPESRKGSCDVTIFEISDHNLQAEKEDN